MLGSSPDNAIMTSSLPTDQPCGCSSRVLEWARALSHYVGTYDCSMGITDIPQKNRAKTQAELVSQLIFDCVKKKYFFAVVLS